MVKDFVPARSNTETGIVVKPHLLERNKLKQVQGTFSNDIITGSITVGDYSGSHGKAFGSSLEKTTNYDTAYMTSGGLAFKNDHLLEQAKFNGELSGSQITVSQTDFDPINPFKYAYSTGIQYKIGVVQFEEPPTPTPTGTPTQTPTPTPSAGLTPTPTSTPIPIPSPTPTPTNKPVFNYRIEDCNGGGSYNAPKDDKLFELGDVVQYIPDNDPGHIICGTITSTTFPSSNPDATIWSPITRPDCDDFKHCDIYQ